MSPGNKEPHPDSHQRIRDGVHHNIPQVFYCRSPLAIQSATQIK